jgi:hypothetical protein
LFYQPADLQEFDAAQKGGQKQNEGQGQQNSFFHSACEGCWWIEGMLETLEAG